ncbi:hypothetical protein AX15_000152 [Amanita polypyramis BW_CC]|nr:hypothetical protein AX15_000152 [Amanita polypyramis BW_CC]
MPYTPSDAPPSEILSVPNAHPYSPTLSSPLARSKNPKQTITLAGRSSPRILGDVEQATSPSRSAKRPHPGSPDMPPSPPPKSPAPANRQREREMEREKDNTSTKSPQSPASTPRTATDAVTVSLAQKLNELATANLEGLLNDDEYRLLRQNLFERFASTAVVPAENPVVPVAKPRPRTNESPLADSPLVSRPVSSNIQVKIPRSPSRTSLSSGVAGVFRRVSGRRSTSTNNDASDASSVLSLKSGTSSIFRLTRKVTRKSSISSVNTTASLAPRDSISISSRRANLNYDRAHAESVVSFARSITGSIKRFPATPPSSYRGTGLENKQLGTLYDDDRLQTSQEIKQEILSVEAEAKNMMDAFNGLELTALTKLQKVTGRSSVVAPDGTNLGSTWTFGQSQRMNVDNDSSSTKSGTSSASMARSAYSARKAVSKKSFSSHVAPDALHWQDSSSSFSSSRASHVGLNGSPVRSTNLVLMRVVPESGVDKEVVMEDDVEEIRRRREEVMMRYEARLEYLRARLKGAQLHEKLLRK